MNREAGQEHTNKGIVNLQEAWRHFSLTRHYSDRAELLPYVRRFWSVEWDLRGREPYRQTVIPHPNVNLVFERGGARIYGISMSNMRQLLEGQGKVLGVKFTSGGFYPFLRRPLTELTGRTLAFEEVFGESAEPLEAEIFAQTDIVGMSAAVERFLLQRLPEPDDNVRLVNEMVDAITGDPQIVKVDDAVARLGVGKRTMQRLFGRYVGVSPKWVIKRQRLHEAAERLENGTAVDWSRLSLELGYYDQAHFIKDFKSMMGRSPEAYAKGMGP